MSVARHLETDTYTNKDINAAVSIGVYTADADRMIVCDVSIDQVAGGGDYVVYITRQIGGSGSAYVLLPKTTCTAASGETAIGMQSGQITVRNGDVLTCYIDGLAGDTTTPDTTVRWFEMAALRPTTADRTLDVSSGGEAGLDWGNVGSPTTAVNLSGTSTKANEVTPLDAAGTRSAVGLSAANLDSALGAISAKTTNLPASPAGVGDAMTLANDALTAAKLAADAVAEIATAIRAELATELARIDAAISTRLAAAGYTAPPSAATVASQVDTVLSAAHGSGSWGGAGGSGAITFTYTLTSTEDSTPIAGADVWVTTDLGGTSIVASGVTDAFGQVVFYLDAGTYYVWRQLAGWTFTNPDTEVVA